MASIITAIGYTALAFAHSLLGERALLRPLFRQRWELGEVPRFAAQRVFRFAWHLTSLAWLGLAALALGASAWLMLATVAAVSGLVIFFLLRGHLAWPIFLMTAFAAGTEAGLLGAGARATVSLGAALAPVVVAALHLWWAAGRGQRMLGVVVPTDASGKPLMRPPWWASLAVGLGLLGATAALVIRTVGASVPGLDVALVLLTIVFALRAVGDGRHVGFTKTRRDSTFARLDDRVYTPLAVLFAAGSAAALL
jgi:hypothetical protein